MADLEMPLTEHLGELRSRLIRVVLATVVGFAICYPQATWIFEFLQAPLNMASESSGIRMSVIGTGVAEAFFTRLKVSIIAGAALATPVILYQVWMFVVPGLKHKEAVYVRGFVLFGTLFFLTGAAFCYQIVFPFGFPFFLAEYTKIAVDPTLRISEYLSFTSRLMVAFGLTFEMPIATFFLARAGMLTHTTLIKHSRYAILVMFVVAAILTPPDAVSQLLMVGPLLVLYGISVGVAFAFRRR